MFTSTNSLFVIPVCDSLGVTRAQFTFHRTIMTLATAAAMPFYGKAIRRFGIKKALFCGSAVLGVIVFCYSFASTLWHFYTLAFINGVFATAVNFMAIGVLVNDWFDDKKGLALGIAYSGSGLGAAVMIPIVSLVIEQTDWQFAYRFMGIVGLVVLIPVVLLLVKDKPEKIGLKPYSSPAAIDKDNKAADDPEAELTFKQALKTSRFWLLAVGFFFIAVFAGATNTHSTPYLTDLGYPIATVSLVISLFMVFLTIGKVILGLIYDRFGIMAGNIFIAVFCLTFPIAALLSHIPAFPWVYAIAIGIASCGISIPIPVIVAKYFGKKDYPMIFSVFTMITTIGPSISVPLMGAVYDQTGSYRPAWVAFLVFSVIISICMITAELAQRVKQKGSIKKTYRKGAI